MIKLRLVPVEVFGGVDCGKRCTHCDEIHEWGYGLMDATSAWSDCNRAIGHIYRVDDMDPSVNPDRETVDVWVDPKDLPFFEKKFDS